MTIKDNEDIIDSNKKETKQKFSKVNILKDSFISRRYFLLIIIIVFLVAIFVFYKAMVRQNKLDQDFQKSRAGLEGVIDNIKNN